MGIPHTDDPAVGFIINRPEGIAVYKGGEPFARVCLLCTRISYNPNDVTENYCACCGGPEYPRRCEHRGSA